MVKKPTKENMVLWFYGQKAQKTNQSKIWPYGSMVKKPIRNRKPDCPHKEQSPRFPQTAPHTTTNT